jgi:hypothetical protein
MLRMKLKTLHTILHNHPGMVRNLGAIPLPRKDFISFRGDAKAVRQGIQNVLTFRAASVQIVVSWVVTPCPVVGRYQRCGGRSCVLMV